MHQNNSRQASAPEKGAARTLISYNRSMKRCPKCHRTYSDESFSFCLDDGALLSAPVEGEATLTLQNQQSDHLAPTLPAKRQRSPGTTRAATPAVDTLPAMVSPRQPPPSVAEPVRKGKWLFAIVGFLAL